MTLAPILSAPPLIQLHAASAISALLLGLMQVLAPKGTIPHRAVGWIWVGVMAVMLISAFINHNVLLNGPFSPNICCPGVTCGTGRLTCASIHLVSLGTFLLIPYAVLHARFNEIDLHKRGMLILLFVVLALGTLFTAIPHRALHNVLFAS